jgi:uncharacterized protein (DUF2147 family)
VKLRPGVHHLPLETAAMERRNKMRKIGLLFTFLLTSAGLAYADSPKGTWAMPDRKFIVSVDRCGTNLCGRIVGLKEPAYANGRRKIDRHNEKASLRSRPLMGLGLLLNMRPAGENTWKGAIYNPDDGKTYQAKLSLDGRVMKVQGCVAGIFCKTVSFTRLARIPSSTEEVGLKAVSDD